MLALVLLAVIMIVSTILNAVAPMPGFSFFVPMFAAFMSTEQAITFAMIWFMLNSLVLTWSLRGHLRADLIGKLLPASILGGVAGALFTTRINELLLTAVLLVFVVYFFSKRLRIHTKSGEQSAAKRPKGRSTVAVGLFSGFLQGGGFGGGDVRNNYLYAHDLTLTEVRATTAAVGSAIFVLSLTTRTIEGTFTVSHAWVFALLIPLSIFAAYLGKHITHKLSDKVQHRIIVVLMAVSITLLLHKLLGLVS